MVIPQTRVNAIVATALGVVSGYYIWNEPLKQYAEKNFTNKDLNKVGFLYYKKIYTIILKINN